MRKKLILAAGSMLAALFCGSAFAQELVLNGDFETIALDELEMPILDDYGNQVPTDWARSDDGDPPPDGTPKTELITNDSNGGGANSVAMNPPPSGEWPFPQESHSDWRSADFPTTPGETLKFSFDFKFLDVVTSPEFQQFRFDLRSFVDDEGATFAGESLVFVSPVSHRYADIDPNTPDDTITADYTDGQWHTLEFDWLVPSIANGQSFDGNFSDVRVSINAFTTLVEGQLRIDNVSVTRPVEGVPGDYNVNGVVDAADYTVWRDTLGSTDDLRANGDDTGASMGVIDEADYAFWKTNFGTGAPLAAGLGSAAVPEPSSLLLMTSAVALCGLRRARSDR